MHRMISLRSSSPNPDVSHQKASLYCCRLLVCNLALMQLWIPNKQATNWEEAMLASAEPFSSTTEMSWVIF